MDELLCMYMIKILALKESISVLQTVCGQIVYPVTHLCMYLVNVGLRKSMEVRKKMSVFIVNNLNLG